MIKDHLQRTRLIHQRDLRQGYGSVHLPYALARKYPEAPREWIWQFLFPSPQLSTDPRSGLTHRLPHQHQRLAESHPPRGQTRSYRKARNLPHTPPLLRHPPARERSRYPHRSGSARAQGCQNDDDLHARAQARSIRGEKPARLSPLKAEPIISLLRTLRPVKHISPQDNPAGRRLLKSKSYQRSGHREIGDFFNTLPSPSILGAQLERQARSMPTRHR